MEAQEGGCENSRHVLAGIRRGVEQREAVWGFSLSGPVFVCWGCVRPGCYYRRPELGKSKVRVLADLVSGEDPNHVSSCGGRGEGAVWVAFIRALVPFRQTPPS